MITHTNQLNTLQLQELEHLVAQCKKEDGSTPNVYTHILNQARTLPASLLFYKEKEMVGFLSAYFFYEDAVEVATLVNPSMRRKGIARQLIQEVLPLIQSQNYENLIFSSPAHLNNPWLIKKGLSYLHSEYYMERDDLNPLLDYNQSLTFRQGTMDDIPVLSTIDKHCFPMQHVDSVARFEHILNGREYEIVIALQNNHPVGKAHLRWQDNGATLSDIAILPAQQGKGLGTALIAHCINMALSEGKPHLSLDVETHNLRALDLYTRLGFVTQNACDYWEIKLHQLSQ